MKLSEITSPADIKGFTLDELKVLASEIRKTIIEGVSESGGHLASSLGVVELTIALHMVFSTPEDKIVWDVGHQCYPHKLLTGRYGRFASLRKYKGIGGFPRRSESPHDAFDTGHSSTSISAALGMAEARDLLGRKNKVIAVIGDGAMTAGLAFEGLNHAGQLKKDLVVILNDNEMSISPNVGAMSLYLNRILTGDFYTRFKRDTRGIIESIPKLGLPFVKIADRIEESLKGIILPGVLFEELGFKYVGPIDGHNLSGLIETLKLVKKDEKPVLLHVITKKGKGYEHSEDDPCSFHGVGPFELKTGSPVTSRCAPPSASYSDVFGQALADLADGDPRIVAITAAMREGTGLGHFAKRHPSRLYDVGIAEPHAVTFAAGMAAEGARPVVAIYSTFLQRSYDEIIHDVCLQNLPVVFAIDRAGIVGEDGPTHQGVFDISYLRHIPNLVVMAPRDALELKAMLAYAFTLDRPVAIRYPRGKAIELDAPGEIALGRAETMMEGTGLAVLSVGHMAAPALEACRRLADEGKAPTLINVRFVKPLDAELILGLTRSHGRIVTVEENAIQGGFGSAVSELMTTQRVKTHLTMIGLPDEFVEQGTQAELRRQYGLDADGLYAAFSKLLEG